MNKERIALWDNLKFILIIFVVIGHFINMYIESSIFKSMFLFIYSFHMPLFFFISGLFHKNINIAKKVFNYVFLGYLTKIFIFITITFICQKEVDFYFLSEDGLPWFMFSLAFFVLITYLVRDLDCKKVLIFALLLGCFVNYDQSIGDFLVLSRTVVFFPFYYLGSIIKKEQIYNISKIKTVKLISIIVILAWGLICLYGLDIVYVLRPLFTGKNPFSTDIYSLGFIYRIICYIITCIIGCAFIFATPSKKIPIISKYGRRTIQVFFWHRPILYILINIFNLNSLLCETATGKLIYLFVAIALTFILSINIFSFPTSLILNEKIKKGK